VSEEPGDRKLTAIMSIDIVGYSALSETDETAAASSVSRLRAALDGVARTQGGRIFNTAGDGFMLEFPSASGALAAAEMLWGGVDRRSVRVGVHVGDVLIAEGGDLLGHSVNIAARLQELANPGSVLVSTDARRAVRGALARRLHSAGSVQLDGMAETIDIFTLEAIPASASSGRKPDYVLVVLPFDNESEHTEMNFFSDGVADEIIATLLRQSKLKIIGRTSAFQFRGDRKREAAAALRATHVLDGAVRCAGAKLRVGAQLIEAGSGMALWSERYDGERADAFTLEDDIAGKVAAALDHALSDRQRPAQTVDPAAYELYLRARQLWLMLSDDDEEHAETLLERCVRMAPDFAPAWAALASVRAFLLPRDRDMIGEPQHTAALQAAERALELDANCAQALAALSLLKPAFAEHGEKLRLVNLALKITPNDPSLHVARAAWLYSVGRIKEAAAALETASRLDPLGPAVEGLRASLMTTRGHVGTALEVVSAAWARWPDSAFIWYMMWVTLCAAGRLDEAEALAAPGVPPRRGITERDVQALLNFVKLLRASPEVRSATCDAMLTALATSKDPLPLSTCLVAAGAGCTERAIQVIEQAIVEGRALRPDAHDEFGMARGQSALQLFVANCGEPIWKHSRFPALAAKLGLAQYWVETKKWPDCAAEVDYDFKALCAAAVAS
jgi:adenylate cyclase